MPSKDIVVDADGHILEPPDLWEKYLEDKYQPRSIKVVKNEKGLECLQYDGKLSAMAQPGFLAALGGMGKEQDQLRPDAERTYVGCAPFGSMDAKERVELLDQGKPRQGGALSDAGNSVGGRSRRRRALAGVLPRLQSMDRRLLPALQRPPDSYRASLARRSASRRAGTGARGQRRMPRGVRRAVHHHA